VERIGHLAMELFFLNTLYGGTYDRIIVLTGPTDQPGVNPAVLEITGPGFVHVETHDPLLPILGFLDAGLLDMKSMHLLLVQPQRLTRDFGRAVTSGTPFRHFSLSSGLRARGDNWMRSNGIDPAEPFVLLHVRDAGYLPEKAHHLFRCANIENYRAAIDRLVDSGYRVFRLGDPSNPALGHPSNKVIDVPHHDGYAPFLDVYLSAHCAFAVNQASGPEALVRAFGRPALTVNLMLEHLRLPLADDLLVFKHIRRGGDGDALSYRQMLEAGLPAFGTSLQFEEAGLAVEENSSDEIDAAVAEMIKHVASNRVAGDATRDSFVEAGQTYKVWIKQDPAIIAKNEDFYAYAHPFGRVSNAFLKANPGFLAD
jgi:putative glycosyltransferase (TIGR04372 family)